MASSSDLSAACDQNQKTKGCDEPSGKNVGQPSSSSSLSDDFARKQFNKNRKVIIRNVPRVTYDEVKQYMGCYAVADIAISKRLKHAIVTLKHGEEAELAVSELSGVPLLGCSVQISLYRGADNLLCVSYLPPALCADDAAFKTFAEAFGPVEKCFLMRFSSGRCKGYGYIEYAHNHEKSELARRQLDGMEVSGSVLRCQFVPSSLVRFSDLESRCLLVTNIPHEISTTPSICNMLSVVSTPMFCQLSRAADWATRFAVVEYSSVAEAELTVVAMETNKCLLQLKFCAPNAETASELFKRLQTSKCQPLPVLNEAISVIPRLRYPSNSNLADSTVSISSSNSWSNSSTIIHPSVTPAPLPLLPTPIVIAPIEPMGIPTGIPVATDMLSLANGRFEAPAVAVTMPVHRPIPVLDALSSASGRLEAPAVAVTMPVPQPVTVLDALNSTNGRLEAPAVAMTTSVPRPVIVLDALSSANSRLEAPAVAMTMTVPRPITGRGGRDQVPAMMDANDSISMPARALKLIQPPQCSENTVNSLNPAASAVNQPTTFSVEKPINFNAAVVLNTGQFARYNSSSSKVVPLIHPTHQPTGHVVSQGHATSSSSSIIGCRTPATAAGSKRRPHFVASPEPSPPEGCSYVGQHSQGIGGHYADSYLAKRRRRKL